MVTGAGSNGFVDSWLQAEPWHRLPLLYQAPAQRLSTTLLESLGYQLRRTALDSSDERVVAAKLGWWVDEWQALAAGRPRHPLTGALAGREGGAGLAADAGVSWVAAAAALADPDPDADLAAQVQRWQGFCLAQERVSRPWLEPTPGDARAHALALIAERLLHARTDLDRQRLPVPLSVLVGCGLTRDALATRPAALAGALSAQAGQLTAALAACAGGGRYRRVQAALARLRATRIQRAPDPLARRFGALPPVRAAWHAWRASSST